MAIAVGAAVHLDGVDEHVMIGDNASFDFAAKFTIGMWFRRDWDDHLKGTTYEGFNTVLWMREDCQGMLIAPNDELLYWFGNSVDGLSIFYTGIYIPRDARQFLVVTGSYHLATTTMTLIIYLNGVAVWTNTHTGIPSATDKNIYLGSSYGTDAGLFLKGSITGFIQSNTTTATAADILTAWNDGVYDTTVNDDITGLVDSIGFTEYTGVAYDNSLNAGVDGAGVNTPEWNRFLDPCWTPTNKGGRVWEFGGANTMVTGKSIRIRKISWVGDDLEATNVLRIADRDGRQFVHEIITIADTGVVVEYRNGFQSKGLEILEQTTGNGTVYVHMF